MLSRAPLLLLAANIHLLSELLLQSSQLLLRSTIASKVTSCALVARLIGLLVYRVPHLIEASVLLVLELLLLESAQLVRLSKLVVGGSCSIIKSAILLLILLSGYVNLGIGLNRCLST